jgi:hypothetical protein
MFVFFLRSFRLLYLIALLKLLLQFINQGVFLGTELTRKSLDKMSGYELEFMLWSFTALSYFISLVSSHIQKVILCDFQINWHVASIDIYADLFSAFSYLSPTNS